MNINEAIAHAREKADKNGACWKYCTDIKNCKTCEKEHEQLAEWLEELKALKENSISKEAFEKMKSRAYKKGHRQGYNKAIDDFVTKYKFCDNRSIQCRKALNCADCIAEQLKAGDGE